jgi:ABC-2 type transport system ATP-binding protein
MTSATMAIEVSGLEKSYAGLFGAPQVALRGVELSVPRATAFGLIGQNGAGKTTFLKTLLGVVRPSKGRVRVLDGDPEEPAVRRRIGYLPERLHLPAALAGVAFLASVARLKGLRLPPRALRESAHRVGLSSDADRVIGTYSKGMKQRLALAAALLGEPDLLVLDEPTDGVDPLGRADIRGILAEERARGATIFLNSHLLSETERICDRIGVLARGKLVREGPLGELVGEADAYRCRFVLPAPAAALVTLGFDASDEAGTFRLRAGTPEELNFRLDAARGAGALLVDLRRDARDLEEVLAAAMQAAS